MYRSFHFFLITLCLISVMGAGCTKGSSQDVQKASQRGTLNVWAVIDDDTVYQPVLDEYRKLHPQYQINFRRFRLEEYEQAILEGLAEDRGPDAFLIHQSWITKYQPKITPMPALTKVAYSVVTGGLKKQQSWEVRKEPSVSIRELKSQFVDVVAKDVTRQINVSTNPDTKEYKEFVLGLPVGIDTMALFYNKDLLNAAGITTPPETWSELQGQVEQLRKRDAQGAVTQAGAGIGTAYNVERAADLLTILMIQSGAEMTSPSGAPTFHLLPLALANRDTPPGQDALRFYTDFANPNKETYTWNSTLPNSLEYFIQGKSAYFFGYSYHAQQIRARAPRLNIDIAPLPQIGGTSPVRNLANYWVWTVSKKSKQTDAAWNLVNYFASPDVAKKIAEATKRPAARKALLNAQKEDEQVGVFAGQVLTSVTWYRGNDVRAAEQALLTMIEEVVSGAAQIPQAMRNAADKIGQTIPFGL